MDATVVAQADQRTATAIEVRGLSKEFAAREGQATVRALEDVTFGVADCEFLTAIGPSGCGKTTLLRIIAGLIQPDEGEVWVGGKRVTGPGPERAMVFQNFALMPWADVLTNVAFGLDLQGVSKQEREARAESLIQLVGLGGFERRLPRELSGGMQQRVGLARALAVDPHILLMDEPFGALDEQTRRLLQEEVLRIWEHRRKTVVFITHSMDEAVLLGDRVMLMSARPGKIAEMIDVPLARPRDREAEKSTIFIDIKEHLWDSLRVMQDPDR